MINIFEYYEKQFKRLIFLNEGKQMGDCELEWEKRKTTKTKKYIDFSFRCKWNKDYKPKFKEIELKGQILRDFKDFYMDWQLRDLLFSEKVFDFFGVKPTELEKFKKKHGYTWVEDENKLKVKLKKAIYHPEDNTISYEGRFVYDFIHPDELTYSQILHDFQNIIDKIDTLKFAYQIIKPPFSLSEFKKLDINMEKLSNLMYKWVLEKEEFTEQDYEYWNDFLDRFESFIQSIKKNISEDKTREELKSIMKLLNFRIKEKNIKKYEELLKERKFDILFDSGVALKKIKDENPSEYYKIMEKVFEIYMKFGYLDGVKGLTSKLNDWREQLEELYSEIKS